MMLDLPNRVQLKPVTNTFQSDLGKAVRDINNCPDVIISADKTCNFYRLPPQDYNQLLSDTITSTYRKVDKDVEDNINKEASAIAEKLELEDRIDIYTHKNPYVSVKDHKPSFPARIETRLINPAKTHIGIIAKKTLDKINLAVKSAIGVQQWKSTSEVIDWFHDITNKQRLFFIKWDICNFYPSITEQLFSDAIQFATDYIDISDDEMSTLMNARQQIITWGNSTWAKKSGLFDVPMGSYDGAECCDLIGLFLLHHLKTSFPGESLGLYRDDGIGVTHKHGHEASTFEKELHNFFKRFGLKIVTEVNVRRTDFLDVIMDLNTGRISPYRKPLNQPKYVNQHSSHPPCVIKAIPKSVNNRLSKLSSSAQEFDSAKPIYQDALKEAGFDYKLEYTQPNAPIATNRRNRNRRCLWFNPPFNLAAHGNITKMFYSIIARAFPTGHEYLCTLFNRRNMKLAYCSTPNIQSILARHNQKVLKDFEDQQLPPQNLCNCRDKSKCPMDNKCLTDSIVYRADVTASGSVQERKFYIGLTKNFFKQRWSSHKTSFTQERYKDQTTLSTYIWQLKEKRANFDIKWSVVRRVNSHKPGDKICGLCLAEKVEILKHAADRRSLNKRNELFSKCRHKRMNVLGSVIK